MFKPDDIESIDTSDMSESEVLEILIDEFNKLNMFVLALAMSVEALLKAFPNVNVSEEDARTFLEKKAIQDADDDSTMH